MQSCYGRLSGRHLSEQLASFEFTARDAHLFAIVLQSHLKSFRRRKKRRQSMLVRPLCIVIIRGRRTGRPSREQNAHLHRRWHSLSLTVHLIAILQALERQHHLFECLQKQMDERLDEMANRVPIDQHQAKASSSFDPFVRLPYLVPLLLVNANYGFEIFTHSWAAEPMWQQVSMIMMGRRRMSTEADGSHMDECEKERVITLSHFRRHS